MYLYTLTVSGGFERVYPHSLCVHLAIRVKETVVHLLVECAGRRFFDDFADKM